MSFVSDHDGVDFIVIHPAAKTELGRALSNEHLISIDTDDGTFESVASYHRWIVGTRFIKQHRPPSDAEIRERLTKAITIKLFQSERIRQLLCRNKLPIICTETDCTWRVEADLFSWFPSLIRDLEARIVDRSNATSNE